MTKHYHTKSNLPNFSRINVENVQVDLESLLTENRQTLELLLRQDGLTWESLRDGLSLMENRLDNFWSPVRHLNAVKNSPELRKVYDACLPMLSAYSTEISQNHELYEHFKAVKQADNYTSLDAANQSAIDKALLQFQLSGIALDPAGQASFKQIK